MALAGGGSVSSADLSSLVSAIREGLYCCYRIALKPAIGDAKRRVYIIQGWNENDDFDAIDVIESNCYRLLENR
jgi:hypothetical protein